MSDLFRTNQDLGVFLPFLTILATVIVCVSIVYALVAYLRKKKAKEDAWRQFHALADELGLTFYEKRFLQVLLKNEHHLKPSSVLLEADRFERLVRPIIAQDNKIEATWVQSIRKKLFQKRNKSGEIHTTRDFTPGHRLFIQAIRSPDKRWWGHLMDVEKDGLIIDVSTANKKDYRLHRDMQVEVVIYLPDSEPKFFSTWVKQAVPGPGHVYILGHSDFLVEKKYRSHDIRPIGPQRSANRKRSVGLGRIYPKPSHHVNRSSAADAH